MVFFSIKYRYSDILLKKQKLHLGRLFCCNHTCYCVNMVSVTSASRYITSASRYHPRFQRRFSMFIRGLIPQNLAELAKAVPIDLNGVLLVGVVCWLGFYLALLVVPLWFAMVKSPPQYHGSL